MSADRIVLEGMAFYAYHGDHPAERALGQRFVVDVRLTLDLRRAGATDDLADTVDYLAVYQTAREVVEGEQYRLLEAVAERLAAALLARYPVEQVAVRVSKPGAPIPQAHFARLAVEITRRRAAADTV